LLTVTLTVPDAAAGAVAVIHPTDCTVKLAAIDPKSTPVAPVKPDPVRFTTTPPTVLPDVMLNALSVGAEAAE